MGRTRVKKSEESVGLLPNKLFTNEYRLPDWIIVKNVSVSIPITYMMAEIANSVLCFGIFHPPYSISSLLLNLVTIGNLHFAMKRDFENSEQITDWVKPISMEKRIASLDGEMAGLKEQSVVSANQNAGGRMREFLSSRKRQILLLAGSACVHVGSLRTNRSKWSTSKTIQNYRKLSSSIPCCKHATRKNSSKQKACCTTQFDCAWIQSHLWHNFFCPHAGYNQIFSPFFSLFFFLFVCRPLFGLCLSQTVMGLVEAMTTSRHVHREEFDW